MSNFTREKIENKTETERSEPFVKTPDLKRTIFKGVKTIWFDKLYGITEIKYDTMPNYCIDNLPERGNEALLKKRDLTLKENDFVVKNKKTT